MSIHDDIALGENRRTWYVKEWDVFTELDIDDDVAGFDIIADLIEDTETILDVFCRTREGNAWLVWRGYEWAKDWPSVQPTLSRWQAARKKGGMNLKYIVKTMIKGKPEWFSYMDRLRECVLELMAKEPQTVMCFCTWVAVEHSEHAALCASVQERLLALDHRLKVSTEWLFEASLMFASGEHLNVTTDTGKQDGENTKDADADSRSQGSGTLV